MAVFSFLIILKKLVKKKKKPLQQTLELFQILNGCKQSVYKFIELSCGLFYTLKMTVVQRESDRTDAQRE